MTDLFTELDKLITRNRVDGDIIRKRLHDWVAQARIPMAGSRGGGLADGTPDATLENRKDARRVSRLLHELEQVERRLLSDARRHNAITAEAIPPAPRRIEGKDMLQAQVAAEGWCISCWRIGEIRDVQKRTGGQPYYRDLCRQFCGPWKNEHGELPSTHDLQRHHDGRGVKVRQ